MMDAGMAPFVVLLLNLLAAAALLFLGATTRRLRGPGRAALAGGLPLLSAVLLAVFVFGDDSYRDDGTSRWDAYRSPGGALGTLFVLSVMMMAACAALLVYSAVRARTGLFRWTALVAGVASLVLLTPTIIGFSSN
jgi:hypothetical protein